MERFDADEVIRGLPRMRRLGGSVRGRPQAWVRHRRGIDGVELSASTPFCMRALMKMPPCLLGRCKLHTYNVNAVDDRLAIE